MDKYPKYVKPICRSVICLKIIGISLLIMAILLSFSLGLDILQGFEFHSVIQNTINPFRVMEWAELSVLIAFLFAFIIESFLFTYRKKKSKNQSTK